MKTQFLRTCRRDGFALVSAAMMMILLVLLALGLLSLSTITLRTSSQGEAYARAQTNARMALMIAIGELQKEMGPDQRISANGDILAEDSSTIKNRHWTGVWNSWKGAAGVESPHSTIVGATGQVAPTHQMAPTYQPNRSDYFRKWLVSLHQSEAASISSPIDLTLQAKDRPGPTDDAIRLVSDGSLGKNASAADYVAARLLDIKDDVTSKITGRYGWWVGDESQKARVMDDSYAAQTIPPLTKVDKIYRSQAPASTGTKMVQGLESMSDDKQLAALPTLKSLDLLEVQTPPPTDTDRPSQQNFHDVSHCSSTVLSDVREGGLKRDLSTLLERPINTAETGNQFMLYQFGQENSIEACVPIQDLAAYYQLYYNDPLWSNGRRGGVNYAETTGKFEIKVPDYGDPLKRDKYLRQYTSLYASPVPVRIQYVLAMAASRLTAAEIAEIEVCEASPKPNGTLPTPMDPRPTHKLLLGVMPVLTLWNPNNVPLVIEKSNPQVFKLSAPPFGIALRKYFTDSSGVVNDIKNERFGLGYAMSKAGGDGGQPNLGMPYIMQFKFAESNDVRFEPGEVKIFSFPSSAGDILSANAINALNSKNIYEPENAFNQGSYLLCSNSASHAKDRHIRVVGHSFRFGLGSSQPYSCMVFTEGTDQKFTFQIETEDDTTGDGFLDSTYTETSGAGFNFWMADFGHASSDKTLHFRNYQFMTNFGGVTGDNDGSSAYYAEHPNNNGKKFNNVFNAALMRLGYPPSQVTPSRVLVPYKPATNAIPVSNIIGTPIPFMAFSLMAGCEAGGTGSGRKTATRPFLHGSTISAPLIDKLDKTALYDFGWQWELNVENVDQAIQAPGGTRNAYYGGGYTGFEGTTHFIQQYLPVLPPISIAALSSAHLGGFSLANQPVVGVGNEDIKLQTSEATIKNDLLRDADDQKSYQAVTATGAAGLAPHVMQAIGNSYAHPNIPANRAHTTYQRTLNNDAPTTNIPYVDHSYLANKALWDDFFFSSMVAQPKGMVPLYESDRTLAQVAEDFFNKGKPLPNRRIIPYKNNLDKAGLDKLVSEANLYSDGLADKIAAHLMVEGAFNVNSTSVEAWKIFLSSLKGKPMARLDDSKLAEHTADGVTVNGGTLANAEPVKSSEISSFNSPAKQWLTGRELSDTEIAELAEAMVKQVKLRGPFLSMSEFVNRRLQSNSPFALKGALQAALDDPSVSINSKFRTAERMLDKEVDGTMVDGDPNLPGMNPIPFAYSDAAKGPIAYGSSAYVDQADVLGHFAEQLTPRGDTFVIRTYGDALDKNGNVVARAWCEAVVQRVPEYVNSADKPHFKEAALSPSSKNFGRKVQMIGFRWLHANEI